METRTIRSSVLWMLIVGLVAAGAAACDNGTDTDGDGDADADVDGDVDGDADVDADVDGDADGDGDAGFIRVLHLSPDAPEVDVYAGEARAVESLSFGESTDYLELPSGTYTFDVTASGATDPVLTFEDTEIATDARYTAVAFGTLASIQGLALVDDGSDLPADTIRVRAIHTAAAVGEVDIWSIPDEGAPQMIYENLGFGEAGDAIDLPAGAYTLGVDANDDAVPDLVFALPDLGAGTVANVFAVSQEDAVFLVAQLDGPTTARIDAGESSLRVVHLSPDAPAVDVFLNGGATPAVSDLAYAEGTGYLSVLSGGYDVQVAASGASPDDAVLEVPGLLLLPGRSYTAVAYDELASIGAIALEDDLEGLADGAIRVRAVHTAVGVGPVDIWSLPAEGDPALVYESLDFGDAGPAIDLPAGAYTLGFDVNGDASPDLIFALPDLPAGTVANVFAVASDEGVSLVAQLEDGSLARFGAGASRIRVIHLSPDAPAVDVFVNDSTAPAVSGLAFGAGTGYLDVPSAGYDFFVAPAGGTAADSVLDVTGLILRPGQAYTAVAFDALSSIQALALVDEYDDLAAGDIRVRAVHAASGVGQVDIWNVTAGSTPAPLYPDFDFSEVGDYLDLPAGAYSLGLDVDDDATPDLTFDLPSLPAGTVATLYAVNDGGVSLRAQLQDGSVVSFLPSL